MTKRKGPRYWIRLAMKRVNAEIAANARLGKYGAGLASEGYAGGYLDALRDVLLLLNGTKPSTRNYYDD